MGTLMYMVNRMSRSNALVVSQRAIAEDLGITRESVNRAVKHLVDHNFVQVIKAAGASVYVVNARVAWQETVGPGMPLLGLMSSPWKASKRGELDNLPPLKSVPKLHEGERLLVGNEQLDPPDQGELELP